VGLTLGTGVGGGVAFGGRLHLGLDGTAGEFGHQTIDPHGPRCGCGNHGCLETFVSGPALAAQGVRAMLHSLPTAIGVLARNDLMCVTPELIGQAATAGDEVARAILARAGTALGVGLANLITMFSPDRVVVGGSVARLGEWLLGPARKEVRHRCHVTPLERVQIVPSALGAPGVIGAAIWAKQLDEVGR
jgi:glucokinase